MSQLFENYKTYEGLLRNENEFQESIGTSGLLWGSALANFCVHILADLYDVHIRVFQVRSPYAIHNNS